MGSGSLAEDNFVGGGLAPALHNRAPLIAVSHRAVGCNNPATPLGEVLDLGG